MGARPYQFAAKARSPRPAHITLGQLHHVIQMVAGWTDEHLHQFTLPPLWHALASGEPRGEVPAIQRSAQQISA
ncbi:IS1096 element passenger TnpR family protein [Cupriavidus basilensis]